mmetsp:Transcript_2104/g.6251  ORF Transcript_2104/g.6251 Transcript_2104/m.6251 type:complete len:218 (+) Transcript_2104:316-969(+)
MQTRAPLPRGWGGGTELVSAPGTFENNAVASGVVHRMFLAHLPPFVIRRNHDSANASSRARWSCANSVTISLKLSSYTRAMSVVSRISAACAASVSFLIFHWLWPPGPVCLSHSKSSKYRKNSLLHWVGVVVHGPSKPLVMVSLPIPVPHEVAGGVGTHAPWVLPKAWPPPISATVCRSSKPMRENASRTSCLLKFGSGSGVHAPSARCTTGPSGFM